MKKNIDLEAIRMECIDMCPEDEQMGALVILIAELRSL